MKTHLLHQREKNIVIVKGPLGKTKILLNSFDQKGVFCFKKEENDLNLHLLEKEPRQYGEKHFDLFPVTTENSSKNKSIFGSIQKESGASLESFLRSKIQGVTRGFFVYLKVIGIGFRVFLTPDTLTLKLGFSHYYKLILPNSVKAFLPEANLICLYGLDKNQLTQLASQIRQLKPPSVYKGKGIRLSTESLRLKVGKKKN